MVPSIHYLPVVPFLDGLFQENTSTKSAGDEEQQVYTSRNAIAESVGRQTAGFHSPQHSCREPGDDKQQVSTPRNTVAESGGRRERVNLGAYGRLFTYTSESFGTPVTC